MFFLGVEVSGIYLSRVCSGIHTDLCTRSQAPASGLAKLELRLDDSQAGAWESEEAGAWEPEEAGAWEPEELSRSW